MYAANAKKVWVKAKTSTKGEEECFSEQRKGYLDCLV